VVIIRASIGCLDRPVCHGDSQYVGSPTSVEWFVAQFVIGAIGQSLHTGNEMARPVDPMIDTAGP
jgi:hypothetical protein